MVDLINPEGILSWLQDNFIAVLVISALLGYLCFMQYRKTHDKQTQAIRPTWKALTRHAMKITNKLVCKVAVIGGGHFDITGDLYLVDSQIEEQCLIPTPSPDLSAKEVEAIINEKKIWMTRKTETYVALRKTVAGGEIITCRMSGLQEQQTIVSEAAEMPLLQIRPELMFETTRMVLGILAIFEGILLYMMFNNIDPQILMDRGTWPWFIILGIIPLVREFMLRSQIGFYMQTYAFLGPEESFKLRSSEGQSLTHTARVYGLRLLYHPGVRIDNTLDIDTDRLADIINNDNERRITALSAETTTLKTKLEFFNELVNQKDEALDKLKTSLEQRYSDGLIDGITRERPFMPEVPDQRGEPLDTLAWFKETKPLLVLAAVLIGAYFIVTGFLDNFSLNLGSGSGENGGGSFLSPELIALALILVLGVIFILRLTK